MKTRKLTRVEIVRKILSIVRQVDRDAGLPELMPCRNQLLMWWQSGDGRRLVVDVGRTETFVEQIDGNHCISCVRVAPGGLAPNGRRLDLFSLVREGYEWMRAPR